MTHPFRQPWRQRLRTALNRKRLGRIGAAVQLLMNLASAPQPSQINPTGRTNDATQQWARHEVTRLPRWRDQARELGYQLRDPEAADHRPPPSDQIRARSSADARAIRERSYRPHTGEGREDRHGTGRERHR